MKITLTLSSPRRATSPLPKPDAFNLRVQPKGAFTRLLLRLEPNPETLWQEAKTQIDLAGGILVLDERDAGETLFGV
jgi:hypothetical protein